MLQHVWVHRDSESGFAAGIRDDPPRDERRPAATAAYLEVIAYAFDPPTKRALEDPSAEIVNLIA
jgi:hypothetical protein